MLFHCAMCAVCSASVVGSATECGAGGGGCCSPPGAHTAGGGLPQEEEEEAGCRGETATYQSVCFEYRFSIEFARLFYCIV